MFKNVFHTNPEDSQKINMNNDWEVQYWSNRFHITKEELKKLARQNSNSIDKIKEKLKK